MGKLSKGLALLGLALLVVSFLPLPTAGGEQKAPAAPTSPAANPVAQGAALFRAKGCVACHRHEAVGAAGNVGPDLTHYAADPVFLRRWLRDPAAVRPGTQMPDLRLQPAEIEALIAFLQSGKQGATSQLPATNPLSTSVPGSKPAVPIASPPVTATAMAKGALAGNVPGSCPVTTPPRYPFRPSPPYPARASYEGKFWYGTDALWTMLPTDGRWDQLLHGEKVWWWHEDYDGKKEPAPELRVSARRLDGEAPVAVSGPPATNGYHPDFHWAMLAGLQVTTPGCWEITGHYEDQALTFVVWVAP